MKPDFSLEDISRSLPDEIKIEIADLMLDWARFDNAATLLMAALLGEFGLPTDISSILIGNLDTKTKVEKIKLIAKHYGNNNGASQLSAMMKSHKRDVEVRNAIAHYALLGMVDDRLVFTGMRHRLGEPGNADVFVFKRSELVKCQEFVVKATGYIFSHISKMAEIKNETS